MKVLVTGADGFIGKNLCLELKNEGYEVLKYDLDVPLEQLKEFILITDYIIHLAGVNRPLSEEEFYDVNTNFSLKLIELIKDSKRTIPIIFSSSTQAESDNDYGKSKKQAENLLFAFMEENENPVAIYRLTNVFGKWCRPNYNSVVATFCYNTTHNLPIEIRDKDYPVNLVYIDDVVEGFIKRLSDIENCLKRNTYAIRPIYTRSLGDLANKIYSFSIAWDNHSKPGLKDDFDHKLYETFLSYYGAAKFLYDLKMNIDERGSFTELIRTSGDGQISVNISKPGITKGNHYHYTKNEKFIVVSGECEIKFRKIGTKEIFTYLVSGEKIQAVDIPPGCTHSIKNVGSTDSVTIMWASEVFDQQNPDTYYEEVEINE